ncbi:SDR family NAD(P)-dependent oxidoreductase [Pelagibacterium sp.]|uniref:SDR family NAD(P)-dependent oxidoreductase n=1 Tax=Pelagibacterium sp. TaxID=1967288 RepID=UPI003A9484DB
MTTPQRNGYDLGGRRAIVPGGAGEIGQAIARRLASCGAIVEIWDLALPAEWQKSGQIVDVTDPIAVSSAMANATQKMGGVDMLVYAAGITGPTEMTQNYQLDAWHRTLDVNLNGAFYCARAALAHFDPDQPAHIVVLASIAGKDGNPRMAAYSAAKAGLIAMTKSIGRELAHTQIRAHAIAPALIQTRLLDQMDAGTIQANRAKIPMGRTGTPDEVAELTAWLVSPGCTFSTGAVHDLSGGRATY